MIEMDIAKRLTDAFTGGSWDGDIDNAPETISPGLRSRITTPASGCAGRRCAYSAQCAVLRSRNTVRDAQIVVTNHALLLSALSIGDSDNGQPLIAPPSDMLLVLDEGHHIGNVAIVGRGQPGAGRDGQAHRSPADPDRRRLPRGRQGSPRQPAAERSDRGGQQRGQAAARVP